MSWIRVLFGNEVEGLGLCLRMPQPGRRGSGLLDVGAVGATSALVLPGRAKRWQWWRLRGILLPYSGRGRGVVPSRIDAGVFVRALGCRHEDMVDRKSGRRHHHDHQR